MGVNVGVRPRGEIAEQSVHRTGSGAYSADSTSFHVDGSMRYVRAEVLTEARANFDVMVAVKNAQVEYEGVVMSPQGIAHIPLTTLAKQPTWFSSGVPGTGSMMMVATIEVFNIEDAAQILGRVQAATEAGRVSLQLWIKQFDPVVGFDLSLGKNAHDYFIMSSHFLREGG